jgi:hypothetical protein
MRNSIALIVAASILILAGCCTTPHVTKWEYRVAIAPRPPAIQFGGATNAPSFDAVLQERAQKRRETEQSFLDDLGKDGWVLISVNDGTFYFKRPIK